MTPPSKSSAVADAWDFDKEVESTDITPEAEPKSAPTPERPRSRRRERRPGTRVTEWPRMSAYIPRDLFLRIRELKHELDIPYGLMILCGLDCILQKHGGTSAKEILGRDIWYWERELEFSGKGEELEA